VLKGYSSLTLVDAEGRMIWDSAGEDQPIDARLVAVVREAITMNSPSHPPPYRDADGRLRLDFVAPLALRDGEPSSAVILRTNPSSYIFPLLRSWPVPSASAETLLFRRDGGQVLYLNDLLYQSNAAAKFSAPLSTSKLLAAQVLRGEITPGTLFEGEDYRKVSVLGVARPVSNTDWYVIAKMDRSEMFAQAWRDSLWLGFGGLLTLFMIVAGAFILRQRQSLSASQRQRETQAERLRSLELLDNLVRSSHDIIYVKDHEGRYLLFNPAGCRFFGVSESDVIGHDATLLLPSAEAEEVLALDQRLRAENRTTTVEEKLSGSDGQRFLLSTKGPLHDAEDRVIGSFCIARDITQRKQTELSLKETATSLKASLSHAQLLVESALDAVIGMDQSGA
jgi:PAS domain S-box-containing protein